MAALQVDPSVSLRLAAVTIGPALLVTALSVGALGGIWPPGALRLPVFLLLLGQMLTGIAGTAGFVSVDEKDREVIQEARRENREERRAKRRRRRQPHSQPHKPTATTGNEPDPKTGPTAPDSVKGT
jgi:hypothetical protein